MGETAVGLYAAKSAVLLAAQMRLSNASARLLLYMALECWDDANNPLGQAPRRYFAGRESSAIGLGYLAPETASVKAHTAVKRAVHELIQAGAITRIRAGGNGLTAEYELQVDSTKPATSRNSRVLILPVPSHQGVNMWTPEGANF
ncbi:hypothetical protein [Cryobacterium sp. PH31-L1]|uniref:hypothetical protein n=1 Tax=Cryobacterium sp. PH31-L1 TaxID=3046199 RepID=UPI0024BB21FD|nr:hypothetical protein [Cryobacterium sp. PH31-L1]MDJ0377628.1 hypothetical protein [Cryobacterium sp. PH31-L1]MDJ0378958.1 hypothetical protein [Cryobacterium sp. PH31-L1]